MDILSAYWLVGDDRLDHSMDRLKASSLYAHLVHSMLYNPRLLISDSTAVNNPNFRYLLSNDGRLKELINGETFAVARRIQDGAPVGLRELRDQFVKDKKENPGFSTAEFANDRDLFFLEEWSDVIPYSVSNISGFYTRSTRDILKSRVAQDCIPADLLKRIQDLVDRQISQTGSLSRLLFFGDMSGDIGEQNWRQYGDRLKQIGSAFYLDALPATVGASPIFPTEYAGEWEILRSYRSEVMAQTAAKPLSWESLLPLTGYIAGLSRLQPEDIHALRDPNGEYGAFLSVLAARSRNAGVSGDEVERCIIAYERKIVERMVARFPELATTAGPRLTFRAQVHDLIEKSRVGLAAGGLAMLGDAAGEFIGTSVIVNYGPYILALSVLGVGSDLLVKACHGAAERNHRFAETERNLKEVRLAKRMGEDGVAGHLDLKGVIERSGVGNQIYKSFAG
jgi:hypothetical protein